MSLSEVWLGLGSSGTKITKELLQEMERDHQQTYIPLEAREVVGLLFSLHGAAFEGTHERALFNKLCDRILLLSRSNAQVHFGNVVDDYAPFNPEDKCVVVL